LQGGWDFLNIEKSDEEDEGGEEESEGFDPGSDADQEEESSDDDSSEVRGEGVSVRGSRSEAAAACVLTCQLANTATSQLRCICALQMPEQGCAYTSAV
jgi:hypothetical protein